MPACTRRAAAPLPPGSPTTVPDMMIHQFLAACAVVAVLAGPALAAPPAVAAPAPLTATDRADLDRIERYLNGVRTLKSKFIQVAPSGRQATGTFYLSRPGKMRLEYDAPVKDFVVADGLFLFYWDAEMRQPSNTPIGSTLADFILRKDIRLSGDVTVQDVARGAGLLEVTLTETGDPGKGSITLIFEDHPLALRKWRVLDAQGLTTEVGLIDPQVGIPLDRDLFYFREPG